MLRLLDLVARLPDWALYALSRLVFFILFYVVRYRRKTVFDNLRVAFPEKSLKERKIIAKGFYSHLSDVVVEFLMLSRLPLSELKDRVEVVGVENVLEVVGNGKSVILLSAHQGNWEWMVSAIASALPCQFDALYRPLHSPLMEKFFMRVRMRAGAHMIPAEKAAKAIIRLRREVRGFGMIGDQNPRRRDEKYWTTFMGLETPVSVGVERIARMMGYPLFYVSTKKLQRGRYRCTISPLTDVSYERAGQISQCYMRAVEADVRAQPECWMWSHQRWRYRRQDCPEYTTDLQ